MDPLVILSKFILQVAGKYDERLYFAQKMIDTVDVFLYEVQFSLKEYRR